MRRTKSDAVYEKRQAVDKAEADGRIADSKEVRDRLMKAIRSGEMTLAEAQSELAKIKRNAKKNGLQTRSQVYNQS